MHIWDLKSGKQLHAFIQKRAQGWNPQWSQDEAISSRFANQEVHFFEGQNFGKLSTQLLLSRLR
jgi:uncharacterized protein with WD repeat